MSTSSENPAEIPILLRRDLIASGDDDGRIRRRVRRGELVRIRHGAYVPATPWNELPPQQQHRLVARAVLRTAHPAAVLSHISAAIELGAPTWGIDLSTVHLTRTDGRTGRHEAGVRRHLGRVRPADVIEANGLRIMSGTRAAIEVCTMAEVEAALVTVNGLLAAGATSMDQLRQAEARYREWPGALRTRVVLSLADGALMSAGESRTMYLCWTQGLPKPLCQVPIVDEHGRIVAYVDFAWPDQGVFLEFDGREKYKRFRREGETLEQYLMREKEREVLICQLTGWTCIRISWADLAHPARTAARIRRILASRGRVTPYRD